MVSELGFMTLDGAAGQTPGKGTWPKLLAWIYKVNDNATNQQHVLNTRKPNLYVHAMSTR